MMIPEPALRAAIVIALVICAAAPLTLIALLIRDWKKGKLW